MKVRSFPHPAPHHCFSLPPVNRRAGRRRVGRRGVTRGGYRGRATSNTAQRRPRRTGGGRPTFSHCWYDDDNTRLRCYTSLHISPVAAARTPPHPATQHARMESMPNLAMVVFLAVVVTATCDWRICWPRLPQPAARDATAGNNYRWAAGLRWCHWYGPLPDYRGRIQPAAYRCDPPGGRPV